VTSRPAGAQHLRDLARLRRVRDRIDREYAHRLDVEALARGARRGDLSITEVCFVVGCSSLGTFSSGFTESVGVPPGTYRGLRHA
jgi:AraC-like DNA-binding protein